jgi:hypothetical protein
MSPFGNLWEVEWDDEPAQDLASAWMNSDDRDSITKAQAKADQLLARDPIKNGRYLSEGLYRIEIPPVVLGYAIDAGAHRVNVTWFALLTK